MGISNSFLLQHFADTVWLLKPKQLQIMADVVSTKINSGSVEQLASLSSKANNSLPSVQRQGDIAILNIEGTLVPKASFLDAMCGMQGILSLHNQFNELVADESVRRIVLYIDSPGGAVVGIPEFAQSIFEARQEKEIVAFTDTCACSGAYYLASAAEQFVATPSSVIGSIGVYTALVKMKQENVEVHVVQAGSKKTFGSPYTELSDEEMQFFADRVDKIYEQFTSDVSIFRDIGLDKVKSTEGAFFSSSDAPSWMVDELNNSNYVLL